MRLWVEARRIVRDRYELDDGVLHLSLVDEMLKAALELGGDGISGYRFRLYTGEWLPGVTCFLLLGLARVAGGPVEVPLLREEPSCAIPGTGLRATTLREHFEGRLKQ